MADFLELRLKCRFLLFFPLLFLGQQQTTWCTDKDVGKRFKLPFAPTLSLARPLPRVRHGVCTGVLALALLTMLASGKAFSCGPVSQQHFDQFGSSNVTYSEPTGSSATFTGFSGSPPP